MKNGINTGQFHVKTGFLGNGRKNLISTSVNTETGSHKYENGRTKIENETGWYGNISVRFQCRLPPVPIVLLPFGALHEGKLSACRVR